MHFADFAERWNREVNTPENYASSTQTKNTNAVAHLMVGLGDLYLDAIEPRDIRTWLAFVGDGLRS